VFSGLDDVRQASKGFALGVAALLGFVSTSSSVRADTVYAANMLVGGPVGDTVEQFDTSGNGSVFISGLTDPQGLAFDSSGNLYVASGQQILKVDPDGNESVFASTGPSYAYGLAFGTNGNLYAALENSVTGASFIEEFDSTGTASVFVSGLNYSVYGRPALAFDDQGNLYTSLPPFPGGSEIEKFDANGNGSILANTGFDFIFGLACDKYGNVFAAVQPAVFNGPNMIVEIAANGNETVFATNGLSGPDGLAFDSSGNLYVANSGNGTIEKFDPDGNGTVFASGLEAPGFLAVQVPEPAAWSMVVLGGCALLAGHFRKRNLRKIHD